MAAMGDSALQKESEDEESLAPFLLRCEVTAVEPLRKKDHILVQLRSGEAKSLQIVTTRADIVVGQLAIIASPGATLNGALVKQQKVAGEWSEGSLVDLFGARSTQSPCEISCEVDDHSDKTDVECKSDRYRVLPRLSTLAGSASEAEVSLGILHAVSGDASKAQYGKGQKIIAHVCNDRGRWGKGFVMAIQDSWGKDPGKLYRKWHKAGKEAGFALGAVQLVDLSTTLTLANMIGQSGIKTGSQGPPVRYEAIQEALEVVCVHAFETGATVHMPKIGSGLAGGEWQKIEEIIHSILKKHGVEVYVYEFSGSYRRKSLEACTA